MFKKLFLAVVLCFSLLLPAFAEDKPPAPNPPDPPKVAAAGRPLNKVTGLTLPADIIVNDDEGFVKVEAVAESSVSWLVLSETKVKYVVLSDKAIIVSIPKVDRGSALISVFAVATVAGKTTPFASTTITVNSTAAKIQDPPTPEQPVNKNLIVIFVIDEDSVTPAEAAILNSATMRKGVEDRTHKPIKIYDLKAKVVRDKKLDGFVKQSGGTPTLIVMDSTGVVKYAKHMPNSEEGILSVIDGLLK